MRRWLRGGRERSVHRLFAIYAAASLVPVLVLGWVLFGLLKSQADAHGLDEGRSDASLIAQTAIAPVLDGHDLRQPLSAQESSALRESVSLAIRDHEVLRLRLRDLDGKVVFSDDSSGGGPDDEALDASRGETVADLTWLNSDANDAGPRGPRVVEVYEPLNAEQTGTRIGVLEMYIPYAPIAGRIADSQRTVGLALGGGLLALWLCLLGVSASLTRRLRRESATNAFLATHDALTGLANRAQFAEEVTRAAQAASQGHPVAVAIIDIDRFQEINDTLGHGNGDRLLTKLAERLRVSVGPEDLVARLGGDEFGIVATQLQSPVEAADIFSRLRKVLNEPLRIGGLPLAVEASVGFSVAPQDGADVDSLLQRADVAMYHAKRQHLGIAQYLPEYDHYDSSALTLIAELTTAIEQDQLLLHFQPKADLRKGAVTSVEALVRWQHPTRGLLYPDAFVPAAEPTELIEPLTWWVLRMATRLLPVLDPGGTLSVAVNISARSLLRTDFAQDLLAVLAGTRTDPRRVILEVTETALLADPQRAARTLTQLHDAGFRISIDDFGAGQTSLGYLAMLPITELKIDKGFVLSMLENQRNAAIVRSVIELGHSLGFTVTAEGVETTEALDRLRSFGCDTVQGYLLSPPAPLSVMRRYLAGPVFGGAAADRSHTVSSS